VKTRPSGEKRRKEMLRQERNREKAEKRKQRKEDKLKGPEPGADADVEPGELPSGGGPPLAPDGGVTTTALHSGAPTP
jgi:hypothetical protein